MTSSCYRLQGPRIAPNNRSRFGHLLNFFQTTDAAGLPGSNFYRLFELAHVPSRFVNTELYMNPTYFVGSAIPGTQNLHPPFNRISRYRDPGRVNLNTVFLPDVWNGVRAGYEAIDWGNLVSSRRGYGPGIGRHVPVEQRGSDVLRQSVSGSRFRSAGASRQRPALSNGWTSSRLCCAAVSRIPACRCSKSRPTSGTTTRI